MDSLDALEPVPRHLNHPVRVVIQDQTKNKNEIDCYIAKIESGTIALNDEIFVFP